MDNQHKIIKGYRDLSQQEIDLINKIKAMAEQVGELVEDIGAQEFSEFGFDLRWVSIAKTDLQKGFMALTRSIAKPTTF